MSAPVNSAYVACDLDDHTAFKDALRDITSAKSQNFAAYFEYERASTAIDLDQDSIEQWLQDHQGEAGVKWLHFWADQSQRPLIEALASRYNISPRLVGLLCPQMSRRTVSTESSSGAALNGNVVTPDPKLRVTHDVESLPAANELKSLASGLSGLKNVTWGDVVDNMWHFHSVDWGHSYIHVGVNTLSVIPGLRYATNRPAGQRLWMSIVLCSDGTVISTLERRQHSDNADIERIATKTVKRHVLSILSQISRSGSADATDAGNLMNIRIRPEVPLVDATIHTSQLRRTESASLLFYYLFDDWMSTYALIATGGHPYRSNLEKVRKSLTKAPDVHILETLHDIGRQLSVLRLMYQSYATVVKRLLVRYQRGFSQMNFQGQQQDEGEIKSGFGMASFTRSFSSPQLSDAGFHDNTDPLASSTYADHPTVSGSALFRFERLLDRIHLYALSEIDYCITEKESLSFMTFNLLALSEAHTVEKLTRITILLAKATILFLPVSLLTAYFSIQVGNLGAIYSLRTYWLSFLVVVVVTGGFLVAFGVSTETVEGQLIYRSLHRTFWDKGIAKVMRRKS